MQEVFDFLKIQAEKYDYLHDVSLIFDSMAIRSQIIYDKKLDKLCGYVNLGEQDKVCNVLISLLYIFNIKNLQKFLLIIIH